MASSKNEKGKKVIIVGGGLVGALNACFLAKRGFQVEVYERRPDIRTQEVVKGRSINLALSCRGREALRAVGLEEKITGEGIPMFARMIHNLDGSKKSIPYGKRDQSIMSVDRRHLNELLLSAAEKYDNVTLHFNHKITRCDFEKPQATFLREDEGTTVEVPGDLIMGCDGAYSSVRQQLMKTTRFDFSQEYIPHGYLELSIPANKQNEYAMELNYLHIWPRNTFMMIALPNPDKTFVGTLFMPFKIFDSIKTNDDLMKFFKDKFPDSIPLMGEEALKESYFRVKALPLVSIKCSPYHVSDKAVLMGDAAHAMVPFYGQGMNCGFEDCLVFDGIMTKYKNDFSKVLPEYTDTRNIDAKAMCDLAMYNYIEMRESVNSKMFLLRKHVDNMLNWLMPNTWVPLYTTVSFTRIRYHQCISNRQWQDKVLKNTLWGSVYAAIIGGAFALRRTGVTMETIADVGKDLINNIFLKA
ncbi:unnamed protein product [Owenia fusiformis]|uniref:Kynurenine 3-monooxygenase n=1 Tax=Owenia fusiformis TaxID=6347 RepID=A0A8J1U5J6_OWEFU|nr:unnamed protein product [Owenia fusiformis]